MNRIDEPIFLVGAERSGTTMLRLMLDHHPDIAFNLESEYLVTRVSDDGAFPDVREYREWLASDRVFQHSRFSVDPALPYIELMNDLLRQKQARDGKPRVGATVHYKFSRLGTIWPNAKYVYLYRDGRDVAKSVVQMGWGGNVYAAADWWLEAEHEWETFRASLAPDRWMETRFEDLVTDTRGQLARLCAFIGVEFSERMFDYTKSTVYGMPDAGLIYQWQRKMPPTDVRLIEARLGEGLRRRGYKLSGLPRKQIGALGKRALLLHARFARLGGRISRYGLALFLQELASRRLGMKSWNKAMQARIDAIVDANIK